MGLIQRYAKWLHTQWPAGTVENLPDVAEDGSTQVPGLYVVGDLTGIPLLKFSAHTGARAIQTIVGDSAFQHDRGATDAHVLDVVIIGGGVSGMAAALEASKNKLNMQLVEAAEPFSTIVNFPKGKPIYTYPTDMTPAGDLQFSATVKEPLVEELYAQTLERGITPLKARAEQITRRGRLLEVILDGRDNLVARRVVVAIGRSGNFRTLGVPGEDAGKVFNRLHDPRDFCGQNILVVGGGDSALETAIALGECGAHVTLSYRKPEFSRPKQDNVERLQRLLNDDSPPAVGAEPQRGSVTLLMPSTVQDIRSDAVILKTPDGSQTVPNDAVFTMLGREAPLDFFRRSGVRIRGEWQTRTWVSCILFVLFCILLYHWKSDLGLPVKAWFKAHHWFPFNVANPANPTSLIGTIRLSMQNPSFYYSLAYCVCVFVFGLRRIRRRRTPYVTAQTSCLIAVQWIPLFLMPYVVLPALGHAGQFGTRHTVTTLSPARAADLLKVYGDLPDGPVEDPTALLLTGALPSTLNAWPALTVEKSWGQRLLARSTGPDIPTREATIRLDNARIHWRDDTAPSSTFADTFFPASEWSAHGREYWRAVGFILAWPLLPWNIFTDQPLWGWIIVGAIQTLVIIPLLIRRWGKGAYCGWICSCGALAETMGDAHRHKMPHGPLWNRVNMIGQVFLLFAFILLLLRIVSWITPGTDWIDSAYSALFSGKTAGGGQIGGVMRYMNYAWFVDLLWAGILGVCFYFWFSGRVWCRFACPLAALMHIYTRFSTFRIAADKKKCISCNVCTSVCHQGIDVMNFANKGLHMEDPECVRCSACVQSCPTGVLEFVQIRIDSGAVTHRDRLAASPVRMAENH